MRFDSCSQRLLFMYVLCAALQAEDPVDLIIVPGNYCLPLFSCSPSHNGSCVSWSSCWPQNVGNKALVMMAMMIYLCFLCCQVLHLTDLEDVWAVVRGRLVHLQLWHLLHHLRLWQLLTLNIVCDACYFFFHLSVILLSKNI